MIHRRPLAIAAGLALALAVLASPGQASAPPPPADAALGFRRVGGSEVPQLLLAQRTIDRDWGLSDDSIYVEVDVPGWKSEPLAIALSAGVPGAGQLYVGEGRGWMFAALELAGWGGWWWYRREAGDLRDQAEGIAGPPQDPASGWSFERWADATEGDPSGLAALYAADPESFYNAIATDPRLEPGWESPEARSDFSSLRIRSDERMKSSRVVSSGLWLNHLIAAVDALRAARLHNLPLTRDIGVRIDGRMGRGGAVAVTLVRKF